MKKYLSMIVSLSGLLGGAQLSADPQVSPYAGSEGWQETKEQRMEWFKDAKFGMFIHFGLYAPAGGYWPPENGKKYPQHYSEWIRHWASVPEPEYGNLTKPLFKPEKGCTDIWARLAKESGMKYMVLTTKHHDGYTLFNAKTAYSQNNEITGSTNISPKGRDLVAEYAKSARKYGMKVGYYYSIIDWQHPHAVPQSRQWPLAANADHKIYTDYMHDHMIQLFRDYGRSDIMWVDYSSAQFQGSVWKTRELLDQLHKLQPQAIVNNRFWNGLQNSYGDFFTPEKYVPATGFPGRTFEVCHTMNESFGFSKHDQVYKTPREVVELLVDIVSKGGNLLMNVGPDPQGHLPQETVTPLIETGKWLKVNGEAIYGTEASPFAKLPFDGRATRKQLGKNHTAVYFHLFNLPSSGVLNLSGIKNEIVEVSVLGTGKLQFTANAVKLPSKLKGKLCPVVRVVVKGTQLNVAEVTNVAVQNSERQVVVSADQIELKGKKIRYQKEQHCIGYWIDAADYLKIPFQVNSPGPVQAGGEVSHQPGEYEVYITYAAANGAGGTGVLSLMNEAPLQVNVPATGGWDNYKRIKVGQITLSKSGLHHFKFKPSKMSNNGFINYRKLELLPID